MQKLKRFLFLGGFFLLLVIFLGSCSSDNQLTITENFSGSGGPGDFYEITLNLTDNIIRYENLTTQDSGEEAFTKINNNLYEIAKDEVYFTKLSDEILIVGDTTGSEEDGLLTSVKKRASEYGNDINGTYNVATSMEGWVGIVEIDTTNNLIDVKLDTNYDGIFSDNSNEQEVLDNLSYIYNESYEAIEINESETFRHFGVFINNEIGIFDSYMWENNDWVGDGMFILVKQDNNINISEYAGTYYSVDKNGVVVPFNLSYNSDSAELEISIDGEKINETISDSNELSNLPGVFEFEIFDEDVNANETHRAIFLPGKAVVVAYEGFENQEDSAGLFVGVKED